MQTILKRLNIDLILLDLDDTLLETHGKFRQCLGNLKEILSQKVNAALHEFATHFDKCAIEARNVHHVNPIPVWHGTLEALAQIYPAIDDSLRAQALETIIEEIYSCPIPLKPGALEFMALLQESGVKFGLVTNASPEWTMYKLQHSGLDQFFNNGNVFVVPAHERKVKEHWLNAMELNAIKPENTIIIGDNFKADIMPALELGATAVYVHEHHNAQYHGIGKDEVDPTHFIEIQHLLEIPTKLEELAENRENKLPPIS